MKKGISIAALSALMGILTLVVTGTVQADLIYKGQGTITSGGSGSYNLIYDTCLDVTWLDYSKPGDIWQNQVNWADGLIATFGSTGYDDWRLPATVDGVWNWGHDGTTTSGFNISSSELGHLFYTELGNRGYYDSAGQYAGDGNFGLLNQAPFENLVASHYWSGTEYALLPDRAWAFNFYDGSQVVSSEGRYGLFYAVAVRTGTVTFAPPTPVPEPGTILLFGSGFAILAGIRIRIKKMRECRSQSRMASYIGSPGFTESSPGFAEP